MGLYQLEQALSISWQWQTLVLGFAVNIATLALMLFTQKKTLQSRSASLFYPTLSLVVAALGYFYFKCQIRV